MGRERPSLFLIGRERHEALRHASEISSLSMSELLRRLFDHAVRTQALDHVVPACSGSFQNLSEG